MRSPVNPMEPLLWLSDWHGQYLPRDFAKSFSDRDKYVAGVDNKTWAILEAGPDHEYYWEVWEDVLNNAVVTDVHGHKFSIYHHKFSIYQDGDCWLVPVGMKWDDEAEFFTWQ